MDSILSNTEQRHHDEEQAEKAKAKDARRAIDDVQVWHAG
jgi:hypothetical protein